MGWANCDNTWYINLTCQLKNEKKCDEFVVEVIAGVFLLNETILYREVYISSTRDRNGLKRL